jgi:IS5 family transposase
LGASRGGLSTKLHLRTDGAGRPLVLLVTPGQRHEVTQLEALLDGGAVKRTGPDGRPGRGRPRKRPGKLAGDKGYSYPSARRLLRQQLALSRYSRPRLPERYRVADDLDEPLAAVVDVAERDAAAGR